MMKVDVQIRSDGFRAKIRHIDTVLGRSIIEGIWEAGQYTRNYIMNQVLSGQMLKEREGNLKKSIRMQRLAARQSWRAGSSFRGLMPAKTGRPQQPHTFRSGRGGWLHAVRIFSVSPIARILAKGSTKTWVIEPRGAIIKRSQPPNFKRGPGRPKRYAKALKFSLIAPLGPFSFGDVIVGRVIRRGLKKRDFMDAGIKGARPGVYRILQRKVAEAVTAAKGRAE